jgi:diguanylate cyclase
VEKFEFENEKVQPSGDITVSIGGSTFPTDANLPQELIVKADQAMYHSKKTGRNRVSLARDLE